MVGAGGAVGGGIHANGAAGKAAGYLGAQKAQVNLLGNTGVFAVLLIIQCGAQPIAGNAQHQRTGCHGSDSQHSSDQGPAGLVPLHKLPPSEILVVMR